MSWWSKFLNFLTKLLRNQHEIHSSSDDPANLGGEDRLLSDEDPAEDPLGQEDDFVSDFVDEAFSVNRLWTIEIFDPDLSMRISMGGDMMEIMADSPDLYSVFDNALEALSSMEETLNILNDQGNGLWIGRVRPIIISF
jgi:hypothetical protein